MRHFLFLLLFTFSAAIPALATVKLSSSGICHAPGTSYYDRTKSFKSFENLADCIQVGGRLPKGSSSEHSKQSHKVEKYNRAQFGRGWDDENGNCRDSRHEALLAQSISPVRFKTVNECMIVAGRWISPYTGAVIHDTSSIDIDHVVPLKWAWEHGASLWMQAKRERFANDPANLLSVEASLNRQKGAKGLAQWLPPANQCQYVARFLRVIKTYGLDLSGSEEIRYATVRKHVCD